ncbi:MAG TPA: enoyl-CoA hydratase/isomerase family protein, partial [Sorangium sp.]|nr:enoyl-CoA hydratase/isomerase family protein [Sorangium sp.]
SSHREVFVSGGDLRELQALLTHDDHHRGAAKVTARGMQISHIETCPLPVVAAVQGATFGGGCELLLMCDLIVMERRASMHFVHGKMGLTPAWGGSTRLLERVGAGNAAHALLCAAKIGAPRAYAMGLAQHLSEAGDGLRDAHAIAHDMAALGRDTIVMLKRSLLAAKLARRGDSLARESAVFADAWATGHIRQAVAAFFED